MFGLAKIPFVAAFLLAAASALPAAPALEARADDGCAAPYVDIAGDYVLTKYGAGANDWHFVTISGKKDTYTWKNKAGVSWGLTRDGKMETIFAVGKECPYYAQGYTRATVTVKGSDGAKKVTGIEGPGKEVYTPVDMVDKWNPVFCPFGDVDATCWADTAYQKCPRNRQKAYDAVMAEKGKGQKGMWTKYVAVIASC